ncbi:MAG: TrkA C-terminal domain-containing protein [Candidatus Egerieousia sp.]
MLLVQRGDKGIIPNGSTILREGDRLVVLKNR